MGVTSIILQKKLNFKMPEYLTFFRTGDIRTACFLRFLCGYTAAVFPAMFWDGSIAASLFLVHLYPHPTGNRARGGGRRPSPISPAPIHYTHKREEMLFVCCWGFFFFGGGVCLVFAFVVYILQLDKIEDVMCFKSEI